MHLGPGEVAERPQGSTSHLRVACLKGGVHTANVLIQREAPVIVHAPVLDLIGHVLDGIGQDILGLLGSLDFLLDILHDFQRDLRIPQSLTLFRRDGDVALVSLLQDRPGTLSTESRGHGRRSTDSICHRLLISRGIFIDIHRGIGLNPIHGIHDLFLTLQLLDEGLVFLDAGVFRAGLIGDRGQHFVKVFLEQLVGLVHLIQKVEGSTLPSLHRKALGQCHLSKVDHQGLFGRRTVEAKGLHTGNRGTAYLLNISRGNINCILNASFQRINADFRLRIRGHIFRCLLGSFSNGFEGAGQRFGCGQSICFGHTRGSFIGSTNSRATLLERGHGLRNGDGRHLRDLQNACGQAAEDGSLCSLIAHIFEKVLVLVGRLLDTEVLSQLARCRLSTFLDRLADDVTDHLPEALGTERIGFKASHQLTR